MATGNDQSQAQVVADEEYANAAGLKGRLIAGAGYVGNQVASGAGYVRNQVASGARYIANAPGQVMTAYKQSPFVEDNRNTLMMATLIGAIGLLVISSLLVAKYFTNTQGDNATIYLIGGCVGFVLTILVSGLGFATRGVRPDYIGPRELQQLGYIAPAPSSYPPEIVSQLG